MATRTPRFSFASQPAPKINIGPSGNYDSQWRKLRDRVLAAEPLCRHCHAKGYVTPAVQVDHIEPKALGGQDTWENCQPLCLPCHQTKTACDIQRIRRGY